MMVTTIAAMRSHLCGDKVVKRRLLFFAFAVAAVFIIAIMIWQWRPHHTGDPLPFASEVESMTAERVFFSPTTFPNYKLSADELVNGRDLPNFEVSRDHIDKILATLRPFRAIDFEKEGYSPWVIVGKLVVKRKNGRPLRVDIYSTQPNEPGGFGVFGHDPDDETWGKYRGGTTHQTWRAIIDAYIASRSQK